MYTTNAYHALYRTQFDDLDDSTLPDASAAAGTSLVKYVAHVPCTVRQIWIRNGSGDIDGSNPGRFGIYKSGNSVRTNLSYGPLDAEKFAVFEVNVQLDPGEDLSLEVDTAATASTGDNLAVILMGHYSLETEASTFSRFSNVDNTQDLRA